MKCLIAWLAFVCIALLTESGRAQTEADLRADPKTPENILTYGMGRGLQRYSPLRQITTDNVRRLVPVFATSLEDTRGQENQPLVKGDLIYTATHKSTFALDARTGWLVWRDDTRYPTDAYAVVCCGAVNRGLALYEGLLFRTLMDAQVQALDARTGEEVWKRRVAEYGDGFSQTVAPVIANGVLITGISGGDFGIRGFIDGWDPKTGERLWRTFTVPEPGQPGSETWPDDDSWRHGGGATWITGSYDPELDLVYWGVGNPAPINPRQRPGDNLFTNSVIAIRPKTGEIVWHYQFSPNDPYDYDGVNELVHATLQIDGRPRKVVMQANRNGFLYVLDRATGELLRANPFVKRITWADRVDLDTGRVVFSETRRRNIDLGEEAEIWPAGVAAKNYAPMAYHPGTGLLYINALEFSMRYRPLSVVSWRRGTIFLGAEMTFVLPEGDIGFLRAVDPLTGQARWSAPFGAPANGGTLATAGGLVFTGDQLGRIIAFNAETGAELWSHKTASGIIAPPVTYTLDGRQHLAVVSGVGSAMASAVPHRDFEHVTRGGTLTVFRLFDDAAEQPASRPRIPLARPRRQDAGGFHGAEHPLSAEAQAGRVIYDSACAACHGFHLRTAGVAVYDLRDFPLDAPERFMRSVVEGKDRMPPLGGTLTPEEILAIWTYIRELLAEGSSGSR